MSQCASSLPLPAYFPAALSFGIAFVSSLIVFIAYCIRERKLRKTFYGITDEMEEDEKQQEDAEALGRFDGEVKVIQSMEKLGPHSIAPTPGSQVKVMMKRRRPAGSTKPPTTSREQLCSTSALTPNCHQSISPQIECEFKYSIEANQNGLAVEIIEPLKSLIIEEVYRARTSNPQQKQLLSEDETRIGEFIVSEMRAKLEGLTNNNPWICHGRLINNTNWVVNGHENLLGSHTDMKMFVKITIEQPIAIVLLGYNIKHAGSSGSCITPVPLTNASKDKLHQSIQVDSTPHPTDPITPSKHSKASHSSALKRMKTAEPINNPARTQIVTVPSGAIAATTTVLSPGRPGTTVLVPPPKRLEKPIGQTPKPPPTPRRTPPKQIIIQTPAPPTPTPPPKTTVTKTTTPKAHTPVLAAAKTITGISHTPTPGTTTTHTVIPTPTAPGITVPKTPNTIKHGKKTRTDDTQLSGEHAK